MNMLWRHLWLGLMVTCGALFALPVVARAEPEVTADLTENRIYVGESVRYRVTLKDCPDSAEPDLSHFDDFAVRLLGKTLGSQSTVIVNGRVTSFSRGGMLYEYLLTPVRSGKLKVPAPTVDVGGTIYRGPELELEVAEPDQQDIVYLELAADRTEVYPLQRFTLKLTVAVKALPEPVADREPVAVQRELPQIIVPWADDGNLPEGITAMTPAGDWLQQYLDESRTPIGFGINNVRARGRASGRPFGGFGGFSDIEEMLRGHGFGDSDSLFSMFNEEARAAFHPSPRETFRDDLQGRKTRYWEYTFERTFTSSKIGEHVFGPVSLKGVFAKRANSAGRLEGEKIYAVSPPVTVRTKDAPLENRPDNYIGAIGEFEIGSQLTPTELKVGDPMTLTVWLQGQGTLANASAPRIENVPEIAARFKVYEATDSTEGDTRRFTYSLRPKTAGNDEFPALEIAYFNVSEEKYVTLQTKPIALNVASAERLAQSQIALPSTSNKASGPEVQAGGIFANITDLDQLRDESVNAQMFLIAMSTMIGCFFVAAIVIRRQRRSLGDRVGQRRRGAIRRAKSRLSDAQSHLADSSNRAVAESVSSALRGLIADTADVPEHGLTPGDAKSYLNTWGVASELQNRFVMVFEECDAARYGAAQRPLDELCGDAIEVVDELQRNFRTLGIKLG